MSLLGLRLSEFEAAGRVIEFSVPWFDRTLFLVPNLRVARPLVPKGVSRGRVWTVAEVRLLAGVRQEDVQAIAEAKQIMNGEVSFMRETA